MHAAAAPTIDQSAARQAGPAARLMQPPALDACLSAGVAAFLLRQEQEGLALLTIKGYGETAWSLFEFLGADPPMRKLDKDFAARWLDWLRKTPWYRRKRGSYPTQFTRQSVSHFFSWPAPKHGTEQMRGAETISKYRRQGCRILKWLGVPFEISRKKRKKFRRLPPIVPKFDAIAHRWQAILRSQISAAHKRQVILTQALILLWGTRLEESLTALTEDMEDHWVLVEGKTGMRITFLNSQALGIVEALRGQTAFPWVAARHARVSGWPWGVNKWHKHVRDCGIDDGKKPQQDLRKRFATWVRARDPEVEMLLAGHGGGVIFDHYLDVMERVPGVMEQFELPKLDGFTWPEPVYVHAPRLDASLPQTWSACDEAAAAAQVTPPQRLYARFDRWLEEQERNAAE